MEPASWRSDFDSAIHDGQKTLTKNALVRLTRTDVERRVPSASFSSRVFVTDCCWVPTSASVSTFALCGLSNDCVCLLNVNNLSKIYLFERKGVADASGAKDNDRAEGDRPRGERRLAHSLVHRQVSVDCCPRLAADGRKVLLGMTIDGAVRSCVLDTISASQLKNLQSQAGDLVLGLPKKTDSSLSLLQDTLFRFSPAGSRAFALLSYETVEEKTTSVAPPRSVYRIALFKVASEKTEAGKDSLTVERAWCDLERQSALSPGATARLRYFGWWDEQSILAVWSDGILQLSRVAPGGVLQVAGEVSLFHGSASCEEEIRLATATSVIEDASGQQGPRPPSAPPVRPSCVSQAGLVAVTIGPNSVLSFNLAITQSPEREPAYKRVRSECAPGTEDGSNQNLRLDLLPSQQSYFTEDVPVRSITLTFLFSWVVTASLESGAVIFLDAQTMELLLHRPMKRLLSEDDEAVNVCPKDSDDDAATAAPPNSEFQLQPKRLRCFASSRPFNMALIEHNTIALFKPT